MANRLENALIRIEYIIPLGMNVESALALVGAGGDQLVEFWQRDGRIDDDSVLSLHLAYEELASNVAGHSIVHSSKDIVISCESQIAGRTVHFSIYDTGPPFNLILVGGFPPIQTIFPPPCTVTASAVWGLPLCGRFSLVFVMNMSINATECILR